MGPEFEFEHMTVVEAIEQLREAGHVTLQGDAIRARVPHRLVPRLRPALQAIQEHKAEAVAVLQAENNMAAAHLLVNRAGARLVCRHCWPKCPAEGDYAILIPAVNVTAEFRDALRVLSLEALPIFPRTDPIDWIRPTPACSPCFRRRQAATEPNDPIAPDGPPPPGPDVRGME